ncbi:MAG: RHS repeat protein [Opitutales bacterium]|nr:RHS repeat protein [Opitutales bacterium]
MFDALGKTHCYAYDLHGNVVAEFGTGAQPAVFSFDDADNLVSQKLFRVPGEALESDPRSRTDLTADETTWRYHASTGLLLAKTYPDEGQIDYAYDAQNRLVSTTWTREVSPKAFARKQRAPTPRRRANSFPFPTTTAQRRPKRTPTTTSVNSSEPSTPRERGQSPAMNGANTASVCLKVWFHSSAYFSF